MILSLLLSKMNDESVFVCVYFHNLLTKKFHMNDKDNAINNRVNKAAKRDNKSKVIMCEIAELVECRP